MLRLAEHLPITKKEFLTEAKRHLSESDFSILLSADMGVYEGYKESIPALKAWKDFDHNMRTELAKTRKALKSSSQETVPPPLRDIFKEETPLLKERHLAERRWAFLEGLEPDMHFDINQVAIYYLKLQIAERLSVFDKQKGRERFASLCEISYE
jgi:hypothetical protein